MKIKVIIVDQDTNYTSHMLQVFQTRYADKVEMRVFSDVNSFYANIREAYADRYSRTSGKCGDRLSV